METNANMIGLYKKMLEVQKALAVVKPDAKGFGYKYASGEQVLGIARPVMDKQGLLCLQEIVESSREENGKDTFAKVVFRFTWVDTETGAILPQRFEADGFNSHDKAIGSAMTYAERYYFLKTFHVPTDDLDPNQRQPEPRKSEPKQSEPKPAEQAKTAPPKATPPKVDAPDVPEPNDNDYMMTPEQGQKIMSLRTALKLTSQQLITDPDVLVITDNQVVKKFNHAQAECVIKLLESRVAA